MCVVTTGIKTRKSTTGIKRGKSRLSVLLRYRPSSMHLWLGWCAALSVVTSNHVLLQFEMLEKSTSMRENWNKQTVPYSTVFFVVRRLFSFGSTKRYQHSLAEKCIWCVKSRVDWHSIGSLSASDFSDRRAKRIEQTIFCPSVRANEISVCNRSTIVPNSQNGKYSTTVKFTSHGKNIHKEETSTDYLWKG